MNRSIYFLLLLVLATTTLHAQVTPRKIAGHVHDNNNKGVEGATVSLLREKDSSVVKLTVAGSSGHFEIEKFDNGRYLLNISAVGFENFYSKAFEISDSHPVFEFSNIALTPASSALNTVTVVARKPLIEQKADRTIVNVDAAISNVGATALEVLEKSPGVSVDRDGNISLKGKQGVMVMIDGKPSYLSNADLATMLSSMNANQLEQIEIMTNPPAKYDAAGNSGIINIKTKKNKQKGFNGNLSLSYGQGRYYKTSNSLNLNYKNPKLNVFLNVSSNANKGFSELHILRTYYAPDGKTITSYFEQPTNMIMKGTSNNIKTGIDYSLTKKTTIGLVASAFISPRSFDGESTGYLQDAGKHTDSTALTISNNTNRWKSGTLNFNVRHQFSKTSELTGDFDYIKYDAGNTQNFHNSISYSDNRPEEISELRGDLPSDINIYSLKADYTKSFEKDLKLEAGWKSSFVKTDNSANYFNLVNDKWEEDLAKTNHFLYEENINAVYVNLNKQYKKWSFQGGLRFENTNYKGNQLGNAVQEDSSFRRDYNNLFPTAYVSYNLDSNNTFNINIGRRIDRPAYQQLNPFLFFINKFTYVVGNPFLLPQYTFNAELSHVFKGILTTTLSYSRTKNYYSQIFRTEGEVTILTQGNLGKMQNIGLSIGAQLNPTKWWSASLNATGNYQEVDGNSNGANIRSAALSGQLNINNQLKFGSGWAAELSGFLNSKSRDAQFTIAAFGQVSAGVSKQILKNKGSIKLNVRDIFYTQVIDGQINYGNVIEHFVQNGESRVVNLAFTYKFGKMKEGGRRNTGGASDEQNRVRAGN